MPTADSTSSAPAAGTARVARALRPEWMIIAVLTGIQITHIMDFVIIMPLGPQFMRVFSISPREFAFLVSAYTFSAAISGFFGALFIDRLDRKTALLGTYLGFAIGTFCCAIAPNYIFLLVSRIVSGFFGGIIGAVVYSIVGDLIPEERRGAALGVLMSAFAMASILGLPLGLYLANTISWHAPFFLLLGVSLGLCGVGGWVLPSVRGHLDSPAVGSTLSRFRQVLMHPNHLRAFALMVALTFSGMLVIPFISPYMVSNVGVSESDLTYIYLVGGAFTFFSSRLVGRLSDRFGKQRMFAIGALLSVIPILLMTYLPPVPLPVALSVTTLFMILTNARFVPAIAMITASVEARSRGSFMSVNASVQQMSSGLAAFIAGLLIVQAADGKLLYYNIAGILSAFLTFASMVIARKIRSASQSH